MNDWLISILGENAAKFVWFAVLFIIFIVAAILIARLITQFPKRNSRDTHHNRQSEPVMRIGVVDSAIIDEARKLILVRRDNIEHLLLIGGANDLVVESYPCHEAAEYDYSRSQINEEQIERYAQNPDYGYLEETTSSQAEQSSHSISASNAEYTDTSFSDQIESDVPLSPQKWQSAPYAPAIAERTEASLDYDNPAQPSSKGSAQHFTPLSRSNHSTIASQTISTASAAPQSQSYTQSTTSAPEVAASKPQDVAISQQGDNQPSAAKKASTAQVHPVYPLGQVSRAVIEASTQYASKYRSPEMPIPATIVQPTPSRVSTASPSVVTRPVAVAPVAPIKDEPEQKLNIDPAAEHDLDITTEFLSEIEIDFGDSFAIDTFEASATNADDQQFDLGGSFEDELLASLDISPNEKNAQPSFEDEMERLLSDLTPGKKN